MTWWAWILAGIAWIAVVVLMVYLSLSGIPEAVEQGLAEEPSTTRVAIAVVTSLVFAVPGVIFIAIGLRRRNQVR